jgi:hypothetical protein
MTWLTITGESEAGGEVTHIVPDNDIKEHALCASCPCEPKLEKEYRMIIHRSFDQRELFETGERQPS